MVETNGMSVADLAAVVGTNRNDGFGMAQTEKEREAIRACMNKMNS